MPWPEALVPLCEALTEEAAALDALRKDMVARRTAFLAPRPRTVEEAANDLQPLADHAGRCAETRAEHTAAVCRALSLDEDSSMRRIAARLDHDSAAKLRRAAKRARHAAERLHLENSVGADLLDLSARVQEGIWQRLIETGHSAPALYDARSRSVTPDRPGGRLVDGQV